MAQTIYEKIENKGYNDALEIEKAGKEKAQRLTEEVITKNKLIAEKMINDAKALASEKKKTKNTELQQAASQSSLKNRKEIIKNTFEKANQKMQSFNNQELENYVVKLLKKANIKGNEIIKVSKEDRERYLSLFSSLKNKDLDLLNKKIGEGVNLSLSEESALINGGFILESDYFDIDFSYTTVLKNLMEEIEAPLATILFEG